MPKLWRLSFLAPKDYAYIYVESLKEKVVAASCFENKSDVWNVEAISNDPETHADLIALVGTLSSFMMLPTPEIHIDEIPETDWLEATWRSFPPRTIGRFYIYGSHVTDELPQDKIGLEVNAATAFGSGEHETTTGCLLTLDDLEREGLVVHNPLDMGCGSGILAMGIAKLWKVKVLAADNDPECIRVTQENAQLNHCDDLIDAIVSEGFDNPQVISKGPFDLIVANILANPLIEMAPAMAASLTPGGRIILSGLLDRHQEAVTHAFEAQGLKAENARNINNWMALTFIRG